MQLLNPSSHPIQQLICYLRSDFNESVVSSLRDAASRLATTKKWVIAPPEFLDVVDEPDRPEIDLPVRTVGVSLAIYSAWPPYGNMLSQETDRLELEEFESVLEMVMAFSRQHSIEMGVLLDGDDIGCVQNGSPDRSLTEGFLHPWKMRVG